MPESEGQRSMPGLKKKQCSSTKFRMAAGGFAYAVLTAPMRSTTPIARSIDRFWSDCLRDRIVVGAFAGGS